MYFLFQQKPPRTIADPTVRRLIAPLAGDRKARAISDDTFGPTSGQRTKLRSSLPLVSRRRDPI